MSAPIPIDDDEPDAEDLFRQKFRCKVRDGVYLFDTQTLKQKLSELGTESGV